MYASGEDRSPTFIIENKRPNKLCEPQSGTTKSILEERSYNYSMEQERTTTVQKSGDATVDDNIVASSTVVKTSVHDLNGATVSNNTVPEII